jgi:hypothetical protein
VKWNDIDGNGVQDAGELGLAGWTIYLDLNNNGRREAAEPSATTNANGEYALSNLSPGTYTVAEVQQKCWKPTFPGSSSGGSGTGGNVLVSFNNTIREYTPTGTPVFAAINVPYGAGPYPATEYLRDIILDSSGLIHTYNGTFDPYLSTYNSSTSTWTHNTFAGWSTANNVSYGGVASYLNYVYLTDMRTFGPGDTPSGIVRFDTSTNSFARFADTLEFIDLTMGLDGILYALSNERTVNAYNPITMDFLWTTTLAQNVRGIAVNEAGDIFGASWNQNIYSFNCDGTQLASINSGTTNLTDIDVSFDGKLVVGAWSERVILTDESLSSVSSFAVSNNFGTTFVAFSTPQTPVTLINSTHSVPLVTGDIVNGINFGSIAL